jgi:outer membrane protein
MMPRLKSWRSVVLAVVLASGLSAGAWAQLEQNSSTSTPPTSPQAPPAAASSQSPERFVLKDYSKPHSPFPNVIAPYRAEPVPPPTLVNTPRIDQFMHEGKIMLSMDDAVALALENNLDIAISRYNVSIADTDILRTAAGANILGVNTGVVQGTPGGGIGGLSGTIGSGVGGTSVAPGGAATGTLGIVSSTLGLGSAISSFDPLVTGTFQMDRNRLLSANTINFANQINQHTTTADFSYLQGFHWGTDMQIAFNNTRLTTNQPTLTHSPELASNFKLTLTQHLLQGFGKLPNTRFIEIARNNRNITDTAFRLQVITTIDQIENIYWDLVYAYENVKVQRDALAFAEKTLSDTKRQVQAGVMATLQLASAQSTVATDQQALIVAQTNLELQQLLMKNALSSTLVDPTLAEAELIPTSTMNIPQDERIAPAAELIDQALQHRGELEESRIDLSTRQLNSKVLVNALLPSTDVFAYYGGSGLGGVQNPANLCANQNPQRFGCAGPPGTTPPVRTESYGDTLSQLVDSTAPDKGIGLTLNVPLRNRVAQANQIRSQLEYRQAQMRFQQLENQVRIEVRNAQFTLQQNRAAVQAAQAAVDLARQSLYAEQRKLQAGISTPTLVLQNESLLTTAQSNLISAMAAYEKSRLELDRATGLLLEHSNILVADAQRGHVTAMPKVPDVVEKEEPSAQPPRP